MTQAATSFPTSNASVYRIKAQPGGNDVVFAGVEFETGTPGVFRSSDWGRTWVRIDDGISASQLHDLQPDAWGLALYAGTENGVFSFPLSHQTGTVPITKPNPVQLDDQPGSGTR